MEFDHSYPNWWGSCSYYICLKSSSLTSCSLRHLGSARSRYSTVSPRTSSIFSLYRNWRSYSQAFEIATVTGHHLAPAQLSLLPFSIFPTGPLYFLPLWWKFIVCSTPPRWRREPSDGCAGIRVLQSQSWRRIYPFQPSDVITVS